MLRNQLKVGQRVYFGRTQGEKTLGKIIKLNPSRAKVETLEARGNGKGCHPGSVWVVPYALIFPFEHAENDADVQAINNPAPKLEFNPFNEDNLIIQAILNCYVSLSPENLTCDGELPAHQVQQRAVKLKYKLKYLQLALGYQVSEDQAYQWEDSRRQQAKRQ